MSGEDFHLPVMCASQAHERGFSNPQYSILWRVRKPAFRYLGTPFYFETISKLDGFSCPDQY